MANKPGPDPVVEKLDQIIGLLQDLIMIQGKRYGLGRDDLRAVVKRESNRISQVTRNIIVPKGEDGAGRRKDA